MEMIEKIMEKVKEELNSLPADKTWHDLRIETTGSMTTAKLDGKIIVEGYTAKNTGIIDDDRRNYLSGKMLRGGDL